MKRVLTRDRAVLLAFGISALIHLSMVTAFRIVIYFPRHDIQYYAFRIVDPRERLAQQRPAPAEPPPPTSTPGETLQLRDSDRVFASVEPPWTSIPGIELPTVQFGEMELLRLRSQGIEARRQYRELFESERRDSWARFGARLESVGEALTRLTGGDERVEETGLQAVSRPAPGYAAYIEWMGGPEQREALSVTKIEALWGLRPSEFTGPITVYFRVNRAGEVISTLPQEEDEQGLHDAAAMALLQYKFEPAGDEAPEIQHGMMVIRREEE